MKTAPIVEERQSFWVYSLMILGVIFVLVGLYYSFYVGWDNIWISIVGLFISSSQYFLIHSSKHEYKKRVDEFSSLQKESIERLHDAKYQEELIIASGQDKHLMDMLDAFNKVRLLSKTSFFDTNYEHHIDHLSKSIRMESTYSEPNGVHMNDGLRISFYCRKCGAKLFGDSLFCHKCGTKIIK